MKSIHSNLLHCLPFAAYTLWLLAVPMDGLLLSQLSVSGNLLTFLAPHICMFLVLGRMVPVQWLITLARAGTCITILATLLLPLLPQWSDPLLLLLGISSAPLGIRACLALHGSCSLPVTAALGLLSSNAALYVLMQVSPAALATATIATLPLLLNLPAPPQLPALGNLLGQIRHLPFVFVFQVVSGLMYGFLSPEYTQHALLHGVELHFYMLSVVAGIAVYARGRDLLLACAIVASMLSFSLLQGRTDLLINLSMYAMQAATGFMDLFLLCLILSSRAALRPVAMGLATLCAGIFCGKLITLQVGTHLPSFIAIGNLILTIAVVTLYFVSRQKTELSHQSNHASLPADQPCNNLLQQLSNRCSKQELSVLRQVLAGKTYREAARDLTISESSVKTYMKRICDKCGVSGREALLRLIREADQPTSARDEQLAVLD